MKQIHTFLCCFLMAVAGIGFAIKTSEPSVNNSYKTLNAAPTIPTWNTDALVPLDLRLDLENKYKTNNDTSKSIEIVHGTIYKDKVVYKYRTRKVSSTEPYATERRKGCNIPAATPDDPVVKPDVDVGREEYPTDTIGVPKTSIILTVDGEEVYKR